MCTSSISSGGKGAAGVGDGHFPNVPQRRVIMAVFDLVFTNLYEVWSGRNRQCQGQYADKGRQGHLDVDTLEQTVKRMEMGHITFTTKSILI